MIRTMLERQRYPMIAALICGAALTLISFVYLVWGWNRQEKPEEVWVSLSHQTVESKLNILGRIEAGRRQILPAPFDGLIEKVSISEGQLVSRGQQLMTMDTSQMDIQVRKAEAELIKARQAYQSLQDWDQGEEVMRARRSITASELSSADTSSKLADARRLFGRGIIARMEVDSLAQQEGLQLLDLAATKAELQRLLLRGKGETLRLAQVELKNAKQLYDSSIALRSQNAVTAPFDGIALKAKDTDSKNKDTVIQPGRKVTQGSPLFEVATLESLNVIAKVEESDLSVLKVGMPASVTGDGFTGALRGKVLTIGTQALSTEQNLGGSYFEVIVQLEAPWEAREIRLGMSARLSIVTYRSESSLVAPVTALQRSNEDHVFIELKDGPSSPVQRIAITTGQAVPEGIEIYGARSGLVRLIR